MTTKPKQKIRTQVSAQTSQHGTQGPLWPGQAHFSGIQSFLAVLISICSSLGEQHRGTNVTSAFAHELTILVCLERASITLSRNFTSMSFFPTRQCAQRRGIVFFPCWNSQYPAKCWAQRRCSVKVASGYKERKFLSYLRLCSSTSVLMVGHCA